MAIQWDELEKQLADINNRLMNATVDPQTRQTLQRKQSHLNQVLEKHREIKALEKLLLDLRTQTEQTDDKELKTLFEEEIAITNNRIQSIQQDLDDLLYPTDPLNNRSVFLEIRAGTGGQEAALFAGDLLKMYTNYALRKNWKVSLVDESTTDLGGIREATLHIQGKNVYGHLKREAGVHRVQRIPKTETQGRVHTSTATIAVLPEAEEVDVTIDPSDLRIDTYRAGGAGGQHVNKTDSAVRITHIPTGIFVACQDDRSQHKNKAKAMKMLQSRLLSAQREKEEIEMAKKRKEMVGSGMRAEKVRTYNFPQNRVTDHQINLTLQKLDMIMEGDLDDIAQAHMIQDREQRKKHTVFE